ncbi:MAG: FtsW/RodA/SpoVE family cell cycle protein [Anaerolineae bacterium]|nr:FtsW/RodA/SpoVE family cell cycle protein [Anaerolineae bacterium]
MAVDTFSLDLKNAPASRTGRTEITLLVISAAFLLVNFAGLALVRGASDWIHIGVWLLCAGIGGWLLHRRLPGHDPLLFPVTMFLSGWGLVAIERLAPPFAERQTVWLAASTAALLAAALLPQALRWLRNYRYLLLGIGLLLLTGTIILGRNPSGQLGAPQLWLGLGSVFFQPSEALKIILVAFLASYLAEQYPAMRAEAAESAQRNFGFSPRVFGPILLMWGISVVILVWQRDLGTAILFFAVFIILIYVASGYRRILISGAVLVVTAGIVAYYAFDVVQLRVDIWLNPWPESDGRAFQIVQSLLAFASGSTFGQGIGQGAPTYIPVVHSDFVFAAVAEEWGLLGIIVVVTCIAVLVTRGLKTAVRLQRRTFLALLAVGLSMMIATQSLLIMGGVLKLVPLTGVTLPFLSYGGSSLLMSFVMIGLLLRLSALETNDAVHP